MSYAVCVTLHVAPGDMPVFLPLMLDNARASLEGEPGCVRFDVLTDPDHPGEVFLYELYDDLPAFDAHLATPHFKAFDEATADMIREKTVRTFQQVRS